MQVDPNTFLRPVLSPHYGKGCSFTFLLAERLREEYKKPEARRAYKQLPVLQDLRRRHPDWLVEAVVDVSDISSGRLARRVLTVSHRWEEKLLPDPSGDQLHAIGAALCSPHYEEVALVWIDFCCLPQRSLGQRGGMEARAGELLHNVVEKMETEAKKIGVPAPVARGASETAVIGKKDRLHSLEEPRDVRTAQEKAEFDASLLFVNLLYLSCSVLILLDTSCECPRCSLQPPPAPLARRRTGLGPFLSGRHAAL